MKSFDPSTKLKVAGMSDLSSKFPVDCSPSSLHVECGPVQPAQALGGKFMGLMKKLMRLTVHLPRRTVEWAQSFTLVTSCTVLFLLAMQMIAMLSFLDVKSVCLSTVGVTKKMQVYRLFTYSHFHSSLPHMLLNVVILSSCAKTIEKNLGSYYLFNVVMIFGTSCAVVQMLLELFISFFYPPVLDDCISGYSGILFGVLVLALGVSVNKEEASYNCCGYVPRGLYPLVVLLLIQLVTAEQISIIANLAGIITGYAYMHDLLNFVKLTPNMIFTLEHSEVCHLFNTLPGFVPYPRDRLMPGGSDVPRVKVNRTRVKKDTPSAVNKAKQQNGSLQTGKPYSGAPNKGGGKSVEKQPNGQSSSKDSTQQTASLSTTVSNGPSSQDSNTHSAAVIV